MTAKTECYFFRRLKVITPRRLDASPPRVPPYSENTDRPAARPPSPPLPPPVLFVSQPFTDPIGAPTRTSIVSLLVPSSSRGPGGT